MPLVTVTSDDCPHDESRDNSRDLPCYDADTSNSSSADFGPSPDEVTRELHHRGFGEAAAKGAKFCPISEETVFLDSPPVHPSSSPLSMDSWMVYSNSSSDEYSLSQFNDASSNEEASDFESCSPKAKTSVKRSCTLQFAELELEDEDDEELMPTVSHKAVTKRLRVKESRLSVPSRSRSPTAMANVDVRMIDFAHTSFVTRGSEQGTSLHQGPDGGFLTGLDSLKRLLSQILVDDGRS